MQTIYKYPLAVAHVTQLDLPMHLQPLCVQLQEQTPTLWVRLDPEAPTQARHIRMFGTGQSVPEQGVEYLGTVQLKGFVWHYFLVHP